MNSDITAEEGVFLINGSDITLDLNGHTITYNTVPANNSCNTNDGQKTGNYCVYGITETPEVRGGVQQNLLFTSSVPGGSIVQGGSGGAVVGGNSGSYSHAINLYSSRSEISNLNFTIHGDDCSAIRVDYGRNLLIHNNYLTSNVRQCSNRYSYDSYVIKLDSTTIDSNIYENTIRGGHGGIVVGGGDNVKIFDNDISHDTLNTNGYGILSFSPKNTEFYNNYIHSNDGPGIEVDGYYKNVKVYNNTIDVMMEYHEPYGYTFNANGIKTSSWGDGPDVGDLKVFNNNITARTMDGQAGGANGIVIEDQHAGLNNEYYNNTIVVSADGSSTPTSGLRQASGIVTGGDHMVWGSGTLIYGNRITSNNFNIDIDGWDRRGPHGLKFISNTLAKGDKNNTGYDPVNYHTLNLGYWISVTKDHEFIDTRFENGASFDDVYFEYWADTSDTYSYYVKWFLDVNVRDSSGNPVSGADISAVGNNDLEAISGTTDAQGNARLTLTQYYRYGETVPFTSNYDYYTPHEVTVTKAGYTSSTTTVTMDQSRTLDVVLGQGAISLQKQADKTTAQTGDIITYTISYTVGTQDITNASIFDNIPSGTTYVSSTNDGTYDNNQVIWNLGNLSSSATGQVQLVVKVE